MNKKHSFIISVVTAFALLVGAGCSEDNKSTNPIVPNTGNANVRVIHTSYDAPAVDVWIDGSVAISNLGYGESSGYASLTSGTRNVKITPTGLSTPVVIDVNLPLAEGGEYSVIAIDQLSSITALAVEDDRTPVSGQAKIRFLHASPDAPAVDIKLNNGSGPVVFGDVAFETMTNYTTVTPGSYVFAVTATGSTQEVVVFDPISVTAGSVYTVVAHGTLNASDLHPFGVRVFVDNGAGNSYVDLIGATADIMVIHASPDAPGVDLLVDNTQLNANALLFPNNTGYLTQNAGTRNVKVNVAGTSTTVIQADLSLMGDHSYSVFAVNQVAQIEPLVLEDDLTPPALNKVHVRFVHLSPDAPAVEITLSDGTIVFPNVSFKGYTAFTPLDGGTYHLQVRLAGTSTVVLDLPGIVLTNGDIYTIFARGFAARSPALGAEIIVNN
jgi:hypothetical protein